MRNEKKFHTNIELIILNPFKAGLFLGGDDHGGGEGRVRADPTPSLVYELLEAKTFEMTAKSARGPPPSVLIGLKV